LVSFPLKRLHLSARMAIPVARLGNTSLSHHYKLKLALDCLATSRHALYDHVVTLVFTVHLHLQK
jgi:hypothetical protein